jgi:hypothetical protein
MLLGVFVTLVLPQLVNVKKKSLVTTQTTDMHTADHQQMDYTLDMVTPFVNIIILGVNFPS